MIDKAMSEKEKVERARQRKAGITRGVRTQRMMSFRLDADLVEYLDGQANKGRFINDCLRAAMENDAPG